MTGPLLQTAAGLAMLYVGGESLIRGATDLAARLGVSPLAIGLTVVAFGTSTPELVVSLDAALANANDICLGNVVGSNIANVTLILGLASLIRPARVEAKVVRVDTPIMIVASLGLIGVLANGTISRTEGGLLASCLIAYTGFTFWAARRESSAVREEFASLAPGTPQSAWVGALLTVGGIALLVTGGHVLVGASIELASALEISHATIGLTVVAVGTSLPELATSVIAAVRRQGDIAVGNVVGSNVFNVFGILGTTAAVHPLRPGGITWFDLFAMVVLALALWIMLAARRGLGRLEGALLLAAYVGYTGWLLVA